MTRNDGVAGRERMRYYAYFAADWLFGPSTIDKLSPNRWMKVLARLQARALQTGGVFDVDRRRDLSPHEFRTQYLLPGLPVVLEGAAASWPAIRKWSPDYLIERCGCDEVPVLDGKNWTVSTQRDGEAVSTSESMIRLADLLKGSRNGEAWYGAFLELLDQYADLRADLDLSFVRQFGHTNLRLPWHRNVLAKMYVGGPQTSTSLHCAGVSNLYVQVYGRKKWVLVSPRFTPYMYPALSNGLNWQSRVDFRNPDYATCPLYGYVDRYETVLEPGDVLWNPPFVWHGVSNVTESIAVSLWWTNVTRAFANNAVLSALTLCGRPNPIAMQLGLSRDPAVKKSLFAVHLNR